MKKRKRIPVCPQGYECPVCNNCDMDTLIWDSYEWTLTCAACNSTYTPKGN